MSTCLIVSIIGFVIALGAISLFIALREIVKNVDFIHNYDKRTKSLYEKIASNTDYTEEMWFIMAESNKMSSVMRETVFHKPVLELSSDIQYHRPISLIVNKIGIIEADIIKAERFYNDEHIKTRKQILNPFTLFYRGIGLIMYVVFGYLISQMNTNFDFQGKAWKIINVTIALFGGIASIWQLIASFCK